MESKELEGIIQKVFSAGVGFERGQSMMEKGHLKMSPKDAVKNILAWHTAEVERAIKTTLEIVAKHDPSYGLPDGDYFHIRVDADTYWQSIPEEVKRILHPQPQKGKES